MVSGEARKGKREKDGNGDGWANITSLKRTQPEGAIMILLQRDLDEQMAFLVDITHVTILQFRPLDNRMCHLDLEGSMDRHI